MRKNLKKTIKDFATLAIAPLGLILFMAYAYLQFGDPIAFYHTELSWNRVFMPLAALSSLNFYSPFYKILYGGAVILAVALIIYGIKKKLRWSYTAYATVMLATYLSFKNLDSMSRYIASIFPLFISLAYLGKNKFWHEVITVFSLMLLMLLTIMFVNGYWVV
jgi:hypothetical protein